MSDPEDVPQVPVTSVTSGGNVPYAATTALVVVDVQNDFADPQGSLSVAGGEAVVDAVNDEVDRARAAGSSVFYTQDWHPPSTPHFEKDGGVWPVHCVAGSWGAQLHPRLVVAGPVVRKGTHGEDGYSGFTMRDAGTGDRSSTGLAEEVRAAGATAVVVVGLATDYCVKATALDGVALGFDVTVIREAVAAVEVEPGDGERALDELAAAGVRLA
jgi:nicotinamidase/pyrazinamidase